MAKRNPVIYRGDIPKLTCEFCHLFILPGDPYFVDNSYHEWCDYSASHEVRERSTITQSTADAIVEGEANLVEYRHKKRAEAMRVTDPKFERVLVKLSDTMAMPEDN